MMPAPPPRPLAARLGLHRWADKIIPTTAAFVSLVFLVGGALFLLFFFGEEHRTQAVLMLAFVALVIGLITLGITIVWRTKRAVTRFRLVRSLMADGREREAIPTLRELIADDRLPNMRDLLHFLLGKALAKTGDTEGAKRTYQQAGEFWPALNNLAAIYLDEGDREAGIDAFKRAIALDPREPLLYNQLALAYEQAGEGPYARKTLELCLKYNPGHRGTQRNLERLDSGDGISLEHIHPRMRLRFA